MLETALLTVAIVIFANSYDFKVEETDPVEVEEQCVIAKKNPSTKEAAVCQEEP